MKSGGLNREILFPRSAKKQVPTAYDEIAQKRATRIIVLVVREANFELDSGLMFTVALSDLEG